MMNTELQQQPMTYEAPVVEVICVEVERGFASTNIIGGSSEEEDMSGGGNMGVGW